jgi:hypothetical protein
MVNPKPAEALGRTQQPHPSPSVVAENSRVTEKKEKKSEIS